MRYDLLAGIALVAFGLGGCAGDRDETATAVEAESSAEPEGILLDSARRPLERAGEVESLTGERKDRLDDTLEEATR
jgi:hypothetical protein